MSSTKPACAGAAAGAAGAAAGGVAGGGVAGGGVAGGGVVAGGVAGDPVFAVAAELAAPGFTVAVGFAIGCGVALALALALALAAPALIACVAQSRITADKSPATPSSCVLRMFIVHLVMCRLCHYGDWRDNLCKAGSPNGIAAPVRRCVGFRSHGI